MNIPDIYNLLMNAPANINFNDLVTLAQDKGYWISLKASISSHLRESPCTTLFEIMKIMLKNLK